MGLFSTPFLRGQMPLNALTIMKDIDSLVDTVSLKENKDRLSDYTSYLDEDVRQQTHKLSWWSDFSNTMKDTYIEFIRTQFHKDLSHLSRHDIHLLAWVNRYCSDNMHDIHNHVDSYISGTYYVNSSKRPIKFWNPNMAAQYAHNGNEDLLFQDDKPNMAFTGCTGFQSDMHFEPTAGDFLMWPSYMMHSVPQADEKDDPETRYSISFNLKHNTPLNDTEHGDRFHYGDIF